MCKATLSQVMKFFGYTSISEFKKEWVLLSSMDRDEIKLAVAKEQA